MKTIGLLALTLLFTACHTGPARREIAFGSVQGKAQRDFRCPQVTVVPLSGAGFDVRQYTYLATGCGYRAKYMVLCSSFETYCEPPAVLGNIYFSRHP